MSQVKRMDEASASKTDSRFSESVLGANAGERLELSQFASVTFSAIPGGVIEDARITPVIPTGKMSARMALAVVWVRWGIGVGVLLLLPSTAMAGPATATVAASFGYTCAVSSGSGVLCWGDNSFGQLGAGTRTSLLAPVAVSGLSSVITAVAAGVHHACAMTSQGGVV